VITCTFEHGSVAAFDTLAFDHGDTIRTYLQCRGRLPAAPTLV
jgi:hypothetical protein